MQVVNTDTMFTQSNLQYALLQGFPGAGIPTIQTINGDDLAATSMDPNFAVNNVETLVVQGTTVKLGGMGFDITHGVAVDLFCACPGGKIPTIFLNPGNPGLTPTLLTFPLAAKGLPGSPATGPGSFVVSNAGSGGTFEKKSNAVSVPIGALVHVLKVTQGPTVGGKFSITVDGTGFSPLTKINFFNTLPGGMVKNLAGVHFGLTFINEKMLMFDLPASTNRSKSYVQAFNPPFVPFTSSDSDPGGSITLK